MKIRVFSSPKSLIVELYCIKSAAHIIIPIKLFKNQEACYKKKST